MHIQCIANDDTDKSPQGVCCGVAVVLGGINLKVGDKQIVYTCGITDYFFNINIVLTNQQVRRKALWFDIDSFTVHKTQKESARKQCP